MEYIEDIDLPQFPSSAACAAARIDLATLKNWAVRKPSAILLTEAERGGPGRARRFAFSFRRVMQIAITADLVKLGFAPRRAVVVAAGFTEVGDSPAGWNDEVIMQARRPGQLYPDGFTILIAHPESELAEVVNVRRNTTFADVLTTHARPEEAVALVNINSVDRRVRDSLGLPMSWASDPA